MMRERLMKEVDFLMKFKKRIQACTFVFGIMLFPAWGQAQEIVEDPQWLADKARLLESLESKQSPDEACQSIWETLWLWAKKGNYSARADLLAAMYFRGMEFPGRSGDSLSRHRDAIILAVHSVGVKSNEFVDGWYAYITGYQGSSEFFECIESDRSQRCGQILVEHRVVPSFENFAAELDMYLENGFKPKCHNDAR